ncbi:MULTISPECIES: isochorismatase family protein [unclassified Pseudoalteromonas]|jgi:isochorismate hydrolase|uniref:isochorismatase family protein n=1 Tax=unclassified Pseudoalteromonas TaxID=194690 RepID=UPI00110968AA|nr:MULTISPECIES: isochorismatase family protein [unclassified Pseudoalteromonas]TMO44003.1 hydrolase [Pseudoalteromonas sp. S4389]
MRHSYICQQSQAMLLIIDEQAGLAPVIDDFTNVVQHTATLLNSAKLLAIPYLFTEQNPSKLGHTSEELVPFITAENCYHKIHFSACLENDFNHKLADFRRAQVVVTGTEAHVCVLQTCLDLLAAGFQVFVVEDAIASRNQNHKKLAIKQLSAAGAIITCTESVIFQWLEKAGTDQFRALLQLIK